MVAMTAGGKDPATKVSAPGALMRVVELLLIALTFGLFGPAVGAIGMMVVVGAGLGSGPTVAMAAFAITVLMIIPALGVGYFIGAIPSVVAGVLIGIKQVWFGGAGWLFALATGAVVGMGLEIYWREPLDHGARKILGGGWLFGIAIFSTLVCWSMMKSFATRAAR